MKNIIFFDESLGFELLENQEANANSIWLYFTTSAAADQVLHITKGYYTYDFELESSTEQRFELESRFWAVDADTTIWLTNADGESPAIYITFPEEVTTNAAVEQTDLTHYFLQGARNEAQEIRMQVIATTNGRDYQIGEGMRQKILELTWLTSREGTTGIYTATILLHVEDIPEGEEETAEITLRYNNAYDELFVPKETIHNGDFVLTISYPVMAMRTNEPNIMQLYLRTSGGTLYVPQQNAKASIMASGLLDTNKFTGNIDCEDIVTLIDLGGSALEMLGITEAVTLATQTPPGVAITAQVELIELGEGLTLADIEGQIDQRIPVSTLTWNKQPGAATGTGADEYTWDALKQSFIWGE